MKKSLTNKNEKDTNLYQPYTIYAHLKFLNLKTYWVYWSLTERSQQSSSDARVLNDDKKFLSDSHVPNAFEKLAEVGLYIEKVFKLLWYKKRFIKCIIPSEA